MLNEVSVKEKESFAPRLKAWLKGCYVGTKGFVTANWPWLLIAMVGWLGGTVYFFLRRLLPFGEWYLYPFLSQTTFPMENGISYFGLQVFYRLIPDTGTQYLLSLVFIYLSVSVLFFAVEVYIATKAQKLSLITYFIFTAFFAFCLFSPLNTATGRETASLYLSLVLALGWFALYRRVKGAITVKRAVPYVLLTVFAFFLFPSIFTGLILLAEAVFFAVDWIRTKKTSVQTLIYLCIPTLLILVHLILYGVSGAYRSGDNTSLSSVDGVLVFNCWFKESVTMLAPATLGLISHLATGGLYPTSTTIASMDPIVGLTSGIVFLTLIIAVLYLTIRTRSPRLRLFVPFGFALLVSAIYYGFFMCRFSEKPLSLNSSSIGVISLCFLAMFVAPLMEQKELAPFHSTFTKRAVLSTVLLTGVLLSYLFGSAKTNGLTRFQDTENYYALIAGRPEEVPVDGNGKSTLGLGAYDTFSYGNHFRKTGTGMFGEHPITNDVKTSYYVYGNHIDGWVNNQYRALLNPGSLTTLYFKGYFTPQNSGGTLTVYVDGVAKYIHDCPEWGGFSTFTLDGFNPDENYFIELQYSKIYHGERDKRDLCFIANEFVFIESVNE